METEDSSPTDGPDRSRARARLIEQAGWHLLAMIDDLLDLSRIEAGDIRLTQGPVPLEGLVRDCLSMMGTTAQSAGGEMQFVAEGPVGAVVGDQTRLRQVLINLLSNAIKYNRPGGHVWIKVVRQAADRVVLSVLDDGLGMSADQLNSLFTPFDRLGRESSAVPGTGIGLTISRHLVELMGGGIEVVSQAGKGTEVTVTLAGAGDEGAKEAIMLAREPSQPGNDHPASHVVYIEDNEVNAILMREILGRRPKIHLDIHATAHDGLQALQAATAQVDLLLLDMHLPDGDGLDIIRQLRANPKWRDLPIVIVSADALPANIVDTLKAGAVAHLTKPLNVDETLRYVDRFVRVER